MSGHSIYIYEGKKEKKKKKNQRFHMRFPLG